MKIFELTQLKEAVDPVVLAKVKAAIAVYKNIRDQGQTQAEPEDTATPTDDDGIDYRTADDLIAEIVQRVLSGEAQLSQDIDAQIGRTGSDPVDVNREVRNLIMTAADSAATQINNQVGTEPSSRNDVQTEVELNLLAAAYGYINKKYNNGSDQVDPNDGPEIVVRAVQSQSAQSDTAQSGGEQASARDVWNQIKAMRDEQPQGPERVRLSNLMNQINVSSTSPEDAAEILAQARNGAAAQRDF